MDNSNNQDTTQQSQSHHHHSSSGTSGHHHHHQHSSRRHRTYEERLADYKKEKRQRKIKTARRWTVALLVVVAGGIIALALYAPHHLKRFTPSTASGAKDTTQVHQPLAYNGLDVSHHQGMIDWQRVAYDSNVKFAYIKATEGNTIVDKQYAHNSEGAAAAKLPFGSYHYFTSHSTPKEQFENFSSTAIRISQVLKPMIKIEDDGVKGWNKQQIQDNLAEMLSLVARFYRCTPLICCSAKFYNANLAGRFDSYQLFLTEYDENEPVVDGAGSHDIWQQPDQSFLKGINTPVSLDAFSDGTTLEDLLISNITEH